VRNRRRTEGLGERDNRGDQAAPNAVRGIQFGIAPSEGVRNGQTAVCGGGSGPFSGVLTLLALVIAIAIGTGSIGFVTAAVFGALLIVVWATARKLPWIPDFRIGGSLTGC
jgi:MFS superfamily sulfate permease-like transporter